MYTRKDEKTDFNTNANPAWSKDTDGVLAL